MKYYIPAIIVVLLLLVFLKWHSCKQPDSKPTPAATTLQINRKKSEKDSTHKEAVKAISEATTAVKAFRRIKAEAKKDTINTKITEPIISACDTVILRDSVAIKKLQDEQSISNAIIALQDIRHKNDSMVLADTSKYFRKEIRKQKFQKWLLVGAWLTREIIPVTK